MLIAAGASLLIKDHAGLTARQLAIMAEDLELSEYLESQEEFQAEKLMAETFDKNMIDKDEYPQTAEIESRAAHMMADLWNAPDAANTVATSAIGSSEAETINTGNNRWDGGEMVRSLPKALS